MVESARRAKGVSAGGDAWGAAAQVQAGVAVAWLRALQKLRDMFVRDFERRRVRCRFGNA